jgi:hypothetical protein
MSYDNLSSVSQNVLKFYQQLTGEERRIPFIFDDFHFCHSRVIVLTVILVGKNMLIDVGLEKYWITKCLLPVV